MGAHVVAIDGPESDRADRYIDCTDKDVPAAVLKASGGGFHSTMIVNSHPSSYLHASGVPLRAYSIKNLREPPLNFLHPSAEASASAFLYVRPRDCTEKTHFTVILGPSEMVSIDYGR
ncbi:Uncharacterized protein HZ326_26975 [Fusarium oxysporum f. sp. albedinis]|nr:Uncharacterized protein HZ326_26975 [Fusarium oxysporum f. sp. albedinis]